ncbi:MAG TPA: protein kinase, partial [Pyrinomonadaceae bacterium]
MKNLAEVLDIARQVASALVAAHEAGITHRDIKPENIMLRRDGFVKVLDFGLAKLSTSSAPIDQSNVPTRAVIRTDPGIVMGTVQYMSPEQARGVKVDHRTDIWSLGVVLYEMLTGHPPFAGETSSHVIVSILESEPAPLSQFLEVPAELQRLIDKTLRKNRDERYQTARDLELDLNNLKRELDVEAHLKRYAQMQSSDAAKTAKSDDNQVTGRTVDAGQGRTTSSVEYLVTEIRKHKLSATLGAAAIVLLLTGISYGLYAFLKQPKAATIPFQRTTITRLTTTGKVIDAAISPDGKYVAYVEAEKSQQSLWVKHVPTGSTVPVMPIARVYYWGLTFSNDSNHIYFVSSEDVEKWKLYKVSVLGGFPAIKVLEHIDSAVTFSPDGKRFAFVRGYVEKGETQLIVANADGSAEQILATRKQPDFFYGFGVTRPSWSPDGELIACGAGGKDATGLYQYVVGVHLENGSERSLTSKRWNEVLQVGWLSDGSGLVIVAEESSHSHSQLWHISYPGGEAQEIMNDLNRYNTISLTADARTLVTTQRNQISNIWIAPKGDTGRARQLTSGTTDGILGLTWTTDGKIVYRSMASGAANLWVMNADGSNQRQLTHEGQNFGPAVSNDGKYIFFMSVRSGKSYIWRMDVNGGNKKRLTNMEGFLPFPSLDGRWVFYSSMDPANVSVLKVPIDGGEPVLINSPRGLNSGPLISPNGKEIAVGYWDGELDPSAGIVIFPIEGGQPIKRLNIQVHLDSEAAASPWGWALNGRALLYIGDNRDNIWSQPIDGSKPTRLTDFQGDELFHFAYSPDGKWLAVARGRVT